MASLKCSNMDYQLFCMLKDKGECIIDEHNLYPCVNCPKQFHSKFECSRLHYMPLKQHIISRSLNRNNSNLQMRMKFDRLKMEMQTPLLDMIEIQREQKNYVQDNYDSHHCK